MALNDDWLALTTEETLEPDLPICDPHHHLWDFRPGSVAPRYFLEDFLEDTNSGHNIVSSVFIECGTMFKNDGPDELQPIGETEFVNGIAAMSASGQYGNTRVAAGIIATAYFTLGDAVAHQLDAQQSAAGGRLRGIRQGVTWHADAGVPNHRTEVPAGMYADSRFRQGFAHLAKRDLTFEAWCYHTQLDELLDLVKQFPNTTIILDHFGGPIGVGPFANQTDEVFADWLKRIKPIAQCDNVMAKLGGINMEVNGFNWHQRPKPPGSEELMQASRRYYETTIELFGVDRCLFESNFPVDKVSCSYNVLWNSFKRLTTDYSADERARLFHDNATRIYRLG